MIIDELYRLSEARNTKKFSDFYSESLGIENKNDVMGDIAWLITSTFHDVAYPIERSDELFGLGEERIVDRIGLERIIADPRYGKLIDQLCDLYVSLQNRKGPWKFNPSETTTICINDNFSGGIRSSLIKEKDHGVLGSLILLHQSEAGRKEYSTIIYPSALAIALHRTLLFNIHDDIIFEKNPLAFLLRYCDLGQEWGRGEEDTPEIPTLEEIKIDYDEKLKMVSIRTKVKLGSLKLSDDKAIEAGKVFGKLKSNEIKFEFIIENNGRAYESKNYGD